MSSTSENDSFIREPVRTRMDKGKKESNRLRDLSEGLDWLKNIIDSERERQVASKLLTLKLLYAGYFGTKGRSTKFAHNPCAIREALRFCRENSIPPPDWTLKYLFDLMSGDARPPTEQDERRWTNLMKLLDLAAEWDLKRMEGMNDIEIERHFRRQGLSETPIQYAKAFVNPESKKQTFDFAKSLNLQNTTLEELTENLTKEQADEIQKACG